MKKTCILISLPILVFLFSGCSSVVGPEKSLFGGGRVTPASANQMFDESFEGFNDNTLIELIDPIYLGTWPSNKTQLVDSQRNTNTAERFRIAFYNANNDSEYKSNGTNTAHRSQIQDRLIAASNQRCNIYTTYLKRISAHNNGILGTLTTALGGAGAIVTGAEAARILAGLAGIASGTRAELNQAIFESVATSVIVPAIQKRRESILTEIRKKRSGDTGLGIEEYTIEGAVADAILYHGACSLDAGIAEAQQSIHGIENVGLKQFLTAQAMTMGSAHLAAIVFTQPELKKFNEKLIKYQAEVSKIDSSKEGQTELSTKLDELILSSKENGDLFTRATAIDTELQNVFNEYVSTQGKDSSTHIISLNNQQKREKSFFEELAGIDNEIRDKLSKLKS